MLNPNEIANALSAVTGRERRPRARQLADEKGVSLQAIYNAAERGGFISGRKKRTDAGTRKLEISDDQLATVAKILHASYSGKGRITMPAFEAISLAENQGIIPRGILTEAYFNSWMRKRSISKKDALATTPHTRLMTDYPNHCHMIDASQCAQWYLRDDGGVAHQRRGQDVYKNKPGKPNQISRLLLVDHYSGAFFAWYVQTENALAWIEFLYLAWSDKSHLAERLAPFMDVSDLSDSFPFKGIPDMIYSDNGAPIRANVTRNVFDRMGVEFRTHEAYKARAKGANEGMQRHWERWFESRLLINGATSLDQLNAWAFQRCREINSIRPHARHGQTRFSMWTSQLEQIRQVPDYVIYRTFATSSPEIRKVYKDGTLTYKPKSAIFKHTGSNVYRVPDVNVWGGEVEVSYCLYDYPRIQIVSRRTGQIFESMPLQKNIAGFIPEISATLGKDYKSPAYNDIQKAFTEQGYSYKDSSWKADVPVVIDDAHQTDELPATEAAEVNVIPFVAEQIEVVAYRFRQAQKILWTRLGHDCFDDLHPAQKHILNALPAEGITQAMLDAVYLELTRVEQANIISIEGEAQA